MSEPAHRRMRVTRRSVTAIVAALSLTAVGLTVVSSSSAVNGPVNTVAPNVTGTAQEGKTLTTTNGTWTTPNPPNTYTVRWQRCNPNITFCADIEGATTSTYTLGSADVGNVVRSVVTATDTAGSTDQASAVTGTVTAAPSLAPVATAPASITGTPANGQTLTAVNGTWTGATPITYTYAWQLCDANGAACAPVAGATAQTFVLTTATVGKTVRVQVTASNPSGSCIEHLRADRGDRELGPGEPGQVAERPHLRRRR